MTLRCHRRLFEWYTAQHSHGDREILPVLVDAADLVASPYATATRLAEIIGLDA
jgi:hypothetical protein